MDHVNTYTYLTHIHIQYIIFKLHFVYIFFDSYLYILLSAITTYIQLDNA
jgi:hypothetical protein